MSMAVVSLSKNISECIKIETFDRTEGIKGMVMGSKVKEVVTDQVLWTEDFTHAKYGRAYTMTMARPMTSDATKDELFLQLNENLLHDILIHDRRHTIVNINPFALPTIYRRIDPRIMTSHYYMVALTEHYELNTEDDPCVEDPGAISDH